LADSVRVQRVAEQIRGELSQILRDEIGDPRIGMVTITRVKLAPDMGAATIFYCPLGEDPDEDRKTELKYALVSATKYCRRGLAKRMKLRHTPELRFLFDDSISRGAETLEVIRSLDVESEDSDAE